MKILVAGLDWHGRMTDYCAGALQALGHEVRVFYTNRIGGLVERARSRMPYVPILKRKVTEAWEARVNRAFVEACRARRPEAVLGVVTNGWPLTREILAEAKRTSGARLIGWLAEDISRFPVVAEGLPEYDALFVSDLGFMPFARALGRAPVEVLAGAAELSAYRPVTLDEKLRAQWGADVAFIGAAYHTDGGGVLRASHLAALSGHRLVIYGDPGWAHHATRFPELRPCLRRRVLSAEEANLVYNAAGLVLNIHHPQSQHGSTCKTYEAAGAGAAVLADHKPALAEHFVLGEELDTYRTVEELRDKVRFYLSHEDARRRLGERGRARVLAEHTYAHRMAQVLRALGLS